MKTTVLATIVATSLVGSIASAATIPDVFTSYYAFGDSLTDDGKLPDFALNPVSDDGRFSNGRTYAEYLADQFEAASLQTANFAIGGATGGDTNFSPINNLSTFGGQIDVFDTALARLADDPQLDPLPPEAFLPVRTGVGAPTPERPETGDNPLVSVLFGGNDFFQSGLLAAATGKSVVEVLEDAADSVADGIREIAALEGGDRFDDFLVLSLPGAGLETDTYNARLALNMLDLIGEGLNIIGFNTGAVFDEIVGDIFFNGGGTFGITGLGPCIDSLSNLATPSCDDPNLLALVDDVHPNAVVHQILGDRVISAVEAAIQPVPLPAGLPLLLAGLGTFAVLRRKRAA